jgi:hypothetical protein
VGKPARAPRGRAARMAVASPVRAPQVPAKPSCKRAARAAPASKVTLTSARPTPAPGARGATGRPVAALPQRAPPATRWPAPTGTRAASACARAAAPGVAVLRRSLAVACASATDTPTKAATTAAAVVGAIGSSACPIATGAWTASAAPKVRPIIVRTAIDERPPGLGRQLRIAHLRGRGPKVVLGPSPPTTKGRGSVRAG